MKIEDLYSVLCMSPSDINEHLPTIKKYCSECNHVTEFGTRKGISTVAILAGKPKRFITYDIDVDVFRGVGKMIADLAGDTSFEFVGADVLKAEIEPTDLLLIDTEHSYNQLFSELTKHSYKVGKYIILHDTISFGEKDQSKSNGLKKGLIQAYKDFLETEEGSNWFVLEIYNNNNGLTILKRKEN
jgi:predicted O-methyltransferase YrrM